MIHFFRRIRQSLLSGSKYQSYFLYALGEILLVVIGILIALKINNENLIRKDIKLETQYLISLKEEFLLNVDKLKVLDSLLGAQLDASHELIQNIHPDHITLSNSRFSVLMAEGFKDTYSYFPSSGVMKDLINSGKLSLIRNEELRRSLADWDSHIVQLKEAENESKLASYQVVEILRTDGNFREQMDGAFKALGTGPSPFEGSNTSLLKSEIFENSVVYFTGITWRLKNAIYPDLIEQMTVMVY